VTELGGFVKKKKLGRDAIIGFILLNRRQIMRIKKQLENLKVIGDRVLIVPDQGTGKTSSGLYLPPTVTEKENVQGGYVAAVGPGTPMPDPDSGDEPWQPAGNSQGVKYLPMEVEVGDYALYLKKFAIEIKYKEVQYVIVPMAGILVVEREDTGVDLSRIMGE